MESSTDGYDLIAVDNIFTKAGEYSVESVFEIGAASFTTSDGAYQGWQLLGTRGEPNWGWGYIAPSLNLVQSYEPGDKRKDNDIIYGKTTIYSGMVQTQSVIDGTTIIGAYSESDPNSVSNGYPNRFCRKGYQPRPVVGGNENYGGNIRMMRWAEVLLIGAEAAVRTGDAKASTWYNAVRTARDSPRKSRRSKTFGKRSGSNCRWNATVTSTWYGSTRCNRAISPRRYGPKSSPNNRASKR